jgi:thioredoxin reductase
MFETNVKEFLGDKKLEGVRLDKSRNGSDELPAKGLFVEIGSEPDYKEYIAALGIKLTKNNFIEVAQDQKTSAPGIWAAGDITNASNGFRQIITACSEGAIAAEDISKNLR